MISPWNLLRISCMISSAVYWAAPSCDPVQVGRRGVEGGDKAGAVRGVARNHDRLVGRLEAVAIVVPSNYVVHGDRCLVKFRGCVAVSDARRRLGVWPACILE